MNYKNLFLLFSFFLCMNACSKNDRNEQPVSESYQSSGPLLIDKLAIYDWGGQYSDPVYIQGFIDRNFTGQRFKDLFYVNRSSINDHGIAKELRFLKDGMAELNGKKMEIISKTDTLMLLAELDSTNVPVANARDSFCWRLHEKVPVYNAAGSCPSGTCSRYRKTYPVMIANGDYYLPTLYFATTHILNGWLSEPEAECRLISQEYPMINFLRKDEDLFKEIGFRDSLLVQVGRLRMVKK